MCMFCEKEPASEQGTALHRRDRFCSVACMEVRFCAVLHRAATTAIVIQSILVAEHDRLLLLCCTIAQPSGLNTTLSPSFLSSSFVIIDIIFDHCRYIQSIIIDIVYHR